MLFLSLSLNCVGVALSNLCHVKDGTSTTFNPFSFSLAAVNKLELTQSNSVNLNPVVFAVAVHDDSVSIFPDTIIGTKHPHG